MADMDILKETFLALPPVKQVIVYAEALLLERYELLAVLRPCIPPNREEDFLQAVDHWIN
jgi:hypothetical protein